MELAQIEKLAKLIRYYILSSTTEAQSGHLTSSLSAVELAAMLFFRFLRTDLDHPENPGNDRLIFSKGHATPLYYSLYAAAGKISEEELLTYRQFGSVLEGHPTRRFKFTETATGSLGQGLSVGVGEAWALRSLNVHTANKSWPKVYVLLGDGEMAEGQVWEAMAAAAYYQLNNLVAILDVNRLGQSQQTMYGHDLQSYLARAEAFGWRTYRVADGHDLHMLDSEYTKAIEESQHSISPAIVVAQTIKGRGVLFTEDKNGWHSKTLGREQFESVVHELGTVDKNLVGWTHKPELVESGTIAKHPSQRTIAAILLYKAEELVPTKKAFGNALVRLGGAYPELIVLDGDVKNSLHTDQFEKMFPERFLQMYVAEQNMVGTAAGLARRGFKPLVATFACFLTRAHDQIRMAALSELTIYFDGSYGGVSVGRDGPSQMGLEDLALFRAVLGSIVLYPSDAIASEKLADLMLTQQGIVYIRTTREPTALLYKQSETFKIGGSKVHKVSSIKNQVAREKNYVIHDTSTPETIAVVSAGITVHEALKAQKELAKEGIAVRVIDCYSIKPIDIETLKKTASETKAIITVEDHFAAGGLGDAVLEALAEVAHPPIYKLAVRKTPRSGKPAELLEYEEIDAGAIVKKVKAVIS